MTLYVFGDNEITPVVSTTFAQKKMQEKKHLQTLIKRHSEVISPNTLIVAEEFSDWEDSQRRIDLLGVDENANLVVIELKRTEDGGHMELQALRYAAMVSAMSLDKLVSTYDGYLKDNDRLEDARDNLYDFLGWSDSGDEMPGQEIKVVLASANFSKELTTSVLWLNDRGLDIRCVRLHPYDNDGQVMVEVQTIIPLPETEEYQVRIREKRQRERVARESARDFSKYDVTIGGKLHSKQNKRNMMLLLISEVFNNGATPQQVIDCLPTSRKLRAFEGALDAEQVQEQLMKEDKGGAVPRFKRFFCDNPFQIEGNTYVLSNQWGVDALDTAGKLAQMFPDLQIEIKKGSIAQV